MRFKSWANAESILVLRRQRQQQQQQSPCGFFWHKRSEGQKGSHGRGERTIPAIYPTLRVYKSLWSNMSTNRPRARPRPFALSKRRVFRPWICSNQSIRRGSFKDSRVCMLPSQPELCQGRVTEFGGKSHCRRRCLHAVFHCLLYLSRQKLAGRSKVGCRFPRWLSSAAHWHSLDTVRAAEDHSASPPRPPGQRPRVSRVSMAVSSTNSSFIELQVFGGLGEAVPDPRQLYYGEDEGSTVLCHKREKMTTVGERVVRLILYQTKGW